MEILSLLNVLCLAGVSYLLHKIDKSIDSYSTAKGTNLATKEDIGVITSALETVKQQIALSGGQRVKVRDLELVAISDFDAAVRTYIHDNSGRRVRAVQVVAENLGLVLDAWYDSDKAGRDMDLALLRLRVFRSRHQPLFDAAQSVYDEFRRSERELVLMVESMNKEIALENYDPEGQYPVVPSRSILHFAEAAAGQREGLVRAYDGFAEEYAKYLLSAYPDVEPI